MEKKRGERTENRGERSIERQKRRMGWREVIWEKEREERLLLLLPLCGFSCLRCESGESRKQERGRGTEERPLFFLIRISPSQHCSKLYPQNSLSLQKEETSFKSTRMTRKKKNMFTGESVGLRLCLPVVLLRKVSARSQTLQNQLYLSFCVYTVKGYRGFCQREIRFHVAQQKVGGGGKYQKAVERYCTVNPSGREPKERGNKADLTGQLRSTINHEIISQSPWEEHQPERGH